MRKIFLPLVLIGILFTFNNAKAQTANMGNLMNMSIELGQFKYENYYENDSIKKYNPKEAVLNNFVYRVNYSLIGSMTSDAKLKFGDYLQFGAGMGYGKFNNETTFGVLIGVGLGAFVAYAPDEDWNFGVKGILWGVDYYTDLSNISNGINYSRSITPMAQYKNYYASAGISLLGQVVPNFRFNEFEFRYNFYPEQEENIYINFRYQSQSEAEGTPNLKHTNMKTYALGVGTFF